jgi:hypothetical protein
LSDRLLLVFLIDALGYRLVRDAGAFSFLEAPDGPVRCVCGYSSACIPSLLTGKRPVEHGHWAMYLRDPVHSVFRPHRPLIGLLAGVLGRHYLTRRVLGRLLRRGGINGYFSLYEIPSRLLAHFDLCEKRDIFGPGGLTGCETPFDAAQRLRLPYRVWRWDMPEPQRRAELEQALRTGRDALLFFYSPTLDAVMHAQGTRSEATRRSLADFEEFVQRMLALARETRDEVRVMVFGDHGMTDVKEVHAILPELEALPLRVPDDFLYFVDSTMVRVWYKRPQAREPVEALLRAKPYGRILDARECEALGILFDDGRYGETIFLMNPGEILAPSFMGGTAPKAMHGYHPHDPDSDTLLLANFEHTPVTSILDIGPLIVRELEAIAAPEAGPGADHRPRRAGEGVE